ncbi:hypothetical protein HYX58_02020 [Candidatus Dependentiae bacterium]|nr:hypothetical protein [Candidatus Dependentiae bacterium]
MKIICGFLINSLLICNAYAGREFKRTSTTTSVERVKKFATIPEFFNSSKTLTLSFLSISDLSGLQDLIPDGCTHLDLSRNHLTNSGLESFKGIFSSTIKSIDLGDNDFTHLAAPEIKQLKNSFPALNALHLSKKGMKLWDEVKQTAKQLNIGVIDSGVQLQEFSIIPYMDRPSEYDGEEPFSSDGQYSPESITLSNEEETVPLLTNSTSSESSDSDDE